VQKKCCFLIEAAFFNNLFVASEDDKFKRRPES